MAIRPSRSAGHFPPGFTTVKSLHTASPAATNRFRSGPSTGNVSPFLLLTSAIAAVKRSVCASRSPLVGSGPTSRIGFALSTIKVMGLERARRETDSVRKFSRDCPEMSSLPPTSRLNEVPAATSQSHGSDAIWITNRGRLDPNSETVPQPVAHRPIAIDTTSVRWSTFQLCIELRPEKFRRCAA